MKKKISISTNDKKLIFNTEEEVKDKANLNNTNVIDVEKMYFSDLYIKQNMETMSSFLNLIVVKKNIKELVVVKNEVLDIALILTKDITNLNKLLIEEDISLAYESFNQLLKNEHLKELQIYSMAPYMFDELDINHNKKISLRKTVPQSNFMKKNNLSTYADIYYAKRIVIDEKPAADDSDDLNSFFRINNNIRSINLDYYDAELLEKTIRGLRRNNSHNVTIRIRHRENENLHSLIEKLSKSNASFFKNNKIKLKILYEKSIKSKYFLKQVNLTMFRTSLIIIIILAILIIALFETNRFVAAKEAKRLDSELIDDLRSNMSDIDRAIASESEAFDNLQRAEDDPKPKRDESFDIYWQKLDKVWDSLLSKNNETVGWINIPNTKVDYPVVQAKDNIFYLNRNFNKKNNIYGWIFMDYRNTIDELSQNTIIYGHRTRNGLMFGTLSKVLDANWYTNPENQVFSFNTTQENKSWQIFSIYTIEATSDYLYTKFPKASYFLDFVKKIKTRSIHDFGVEIEENDKLITLSTCFKDSSQRLVIHAKAIN